VKVGVKISKRQMEELAHTHVGDLPWTERHFCRIVLLVIPVNNNTMQFSNVVLYFIRMKV